MIGVSLLFYVAGLLTAAFCAIYLYFQYRFTYWKKLGVPSADSVVFPYGSLQNVISGTMPLGVDLISHYNVMKAQGNNFFGMYSFHNPMFVPVSIDLVKSIMAKDFAYFMDRGVYHDEKEDPLSAHLFSLNGQKWKNLRAKLTPTFTSGKMKKMFQTLVDCSSELKDCLNESIEKDEPIDIKQILIQYTTDVIGSCAFGIECNSFKNPNTEFIQSGNKIFSPQGFDRFKLFFAFGFPWLAKLFRVRLTNKEVDHFYRNLVKDTINYREQNKVTRNDFMQLLMELKDKGVIEDEEQEIKPQHDGTTLTLDEVSAQAFLFFVAGFETSSTTMQFCIFELARNPDVQKKLRNEIIRVLKKHEGNITYEAVMDMHYMDQVLQEAMRKYPALMFMQREVTKDYTVPDTDLVLKKGTVVVVPVLAIQLDPEFYPDPENFDPERFTEEGKSGRPDYTWLPFGEGPRVCIGQRFAMMQMKVGLCQLFLNYTFSVNSKTKTPLEMEALSFVASPKEKIWLNAHLNQ